MIMKTKLTLMLLSNRSKIKIKEKKLKMINQVNIGDKIEGWKMIHQIWAWGLIRKIVARKGTNLEK